MSPTEEWQNLPVTAATNEGCLGGLPVAILPPALSRGAMSLQNFRRALAVALLSTATASVLSAQTPAAPAAATVPTVGSMAPDFTLPGATRYGRLAEPVRLSDFRGKTVVIAFFYQARTKG